VYLYNIDTYKSKPVAIECEDIKSSRHSITNGYWLVAFSLYLH